MMIITYLIKSQGYCGENINFSNCFNISIGQASTLIKAMMADKVLQPTSQSKKYAKYVLTPQYREKIFG